MVKFDTSFDMREDATGPDPDSSSKTLATYHQLLWSKELPSGARFDLEIIRNSGYQLRHSSDLGDFRLSSDSVMQTYIRWESMQHIVSQLSEAENDEFMSVGYTIGGMMIWPCDQRPGGQTINQHRGRDQHSIGDRMDLTLECIRRHYAGGESPLGETLARYGDFFDLFVDFGGFTEFFLLQDMVAADGQGVSFFLPFEGFESPARPRDVDSYREFRSRSLEFNHSRNRRMQAWVASTCS
jgi:hypothetical protein